MIFLKLKKSIIFFLIEDACHALGSKYKFKNKSVHVGSCKHSDISTFSLHPVKTFTTGEGGLVTTNSKLLNSRIKLFRSHGIERNKKSHWQYDIKEFGFNYRLSDINCALGISQLKKINRFIKSRKTIYNFYKKEFQKFSDIIKVINFSKSCKPSYHLMLVSIDFANTKKTKQKLLKFLQKNSVLAQYHYIPIFKFSAYPKKNDYFEICNELLQINYKSSYLLQSRKKKYKKNCISYY